MNGVVTTLKVLVAVVLLASAPLALKRRWRLFLAIPLSVFQLFVPGLQVAGVPIPMAFWGGLMLWPELIREIRVVVTWKPTFCLLAIVAMYMISLLWSPERRLALQPTGYFLQFLVIFSAVLTEARHDEKLIVRLLAITVGFALLQSLVVVLFYLRPGLKLIFLTSDLSKWLISPNSLSVLFTTGRNNVLSPWKSGGLSFTDANVGAAYLGVTACIALGLALYLRRKLFGFIGGVLIAAVPFCGSKGGIILAALISILTLHVISLRYRGLRTRARLAMIAILMLGVAGWLGPKAMLGSESGGYRLLAALLEKSHVSLSGREDLWVYGSQAFLQHPIKGQGFGGWELDFPRYARKVGLSSDLLPQNTIVYLWSQGGLMAALLGLGFIYYVLRFGWRQIQDPSSPAFGLSMATIMASTWIFVQGMGENYGLIGDVHMSPLLASLLALSYLHRHPVLDRTTEYIDDTQNVAPSYIARPMAGS